MLLMKGWTQKKREDVETKEEKETISSEGISDEVAESDHFQESRPMRRLSRKRARSAA